MCQAARVLHSANYLLVLLMHDFCRTSGSLFDASITSLCDGAVVPVATSLKCIYGTNENRDDLGDGETIPMWIHTILRCIHC